MLEDLINILIEATDHDSIAWNCHTSGEYSVKLRGYMVVSSVSRILLQEDEESFDLPPSPALQDAIVRQASRKQKF